MNMQRITTLLVSLAIAGSLSAQISYYTASLTGAQEVPPNTSTATGKALITVNTSTNVLNITTPALGANDFAAPSFLFTITLKDARASTKAALLLGASKTTFNALTLPFALNVIGMPGCSLLTSDFGLGLQASTDATGAASL